jgi:hypothetical protein
MTWTKTPDDYPDRHLELSDAAYRLHHAATTYCNRVGLDGRIPKARLSLVPVPSRTRRPGIIVELVTADLWSDDGDAWRLIDFFDDQMSAEEVGLTREYNRVRQAIRFAKDDKRRVALKEEERTVLNELQAARERRRGLSRSANSGATHRPAPSLNESEDGRRGLARLRMARRPQSLTRSVMSTTTSAGSAVDLLIGSMERTRSWWCGRTPPSEKATGPASMTAFLGLGRNLR